MRKTLIAGAFILLSAAALPADDWTTGPGANGWGAFSRAQDGARMLQLGCFGSATGGLSFLLIGGPAALPATVQKDTAVMIWITLPDNRTGRYPVDTEYLGGGDNALIGTLLLGQEGFDFFARGARLTITDVTGGTLFATGMSGSARARAAFRSACGL